MASSLIGTNGMALVTAVALSGTLILVALCRPKTSPAISSISVRRALRPCISSVHRKRNKNKKRVRFAEDVIFKFESDSNSDNEDDDMMYLPEYMNVGCDENDLLSEIPANWAALYSGILHDRVERMTCYD